MKDKKIVFALCFVVSSAFGASLSDRALVYVPGGKILRETEKEVKVQTSSGTVVEVEFNSDGSFEEASGNAVDRDVLVPGEGILSLKDALESMKKKGKNPVGEWSLEKSFVKGWHYEFEGFEQGKSMYYVIDAKTGALLSEKIDQ